MTRHGNSTEPRQVSRLRHENPCLETRHVSRFETRHLETPSLVLCLVQTGEWKAQEIQESRDVYCHAEAVDQVGTCWPSWLHYLVFSVCLCGCKYELLINWQKTQDMRIVLTDAHLIHSENFLCLSQLLYCGLKLSCIVFSVILHMQLFLLKL